MNNQLNIFEGNKLRDIGINQSFDHAETKSISWGESAYSFLRQYIKSNNQFMAEDVRVASKGVVEDPPSKRAWGAIFVMAKKNELIRSIGYGRVKNPKAHRTPATLWEVVND